MSCKNGIRGEAVRKAKNSRNTVLRKIRYLRKANRFIQNGGVNTVKENVALLFRSAEHGIYNWPEPICNFVFSIMKRMQCGAFDECC